MLCHARRVAVNPAYHDRTSGFPFPTGRRTRRPWIARFLLAIVRMLYFDVCRFSWRSHKTVLFVPSCIRASSLSRERERERERERNVCWFIQRFLLAYAPSAAAKIKRDVYFLEGRFISGAGEIVDLSARIVEMKYLYSSLETRSSANKWKSLRVKREKGILLEVREWKKEGGLLRKIANYRARITVARSPQAKAEVDSGKLLQVKTKRSWNEKSRSRGLWSPDDNTDNTLRPTTLLERYSRSIEKKSSK